MDSEPSSHGGEYKFFRQTSRDPEMGTGKKKIEIKKIEKPRPRMVTFSKRRQGLFKKASKYTDKTGSAVAILVFSPAGRVYVHGSPCFDTLIEKFMKENGCQDGVNIVDKTVIGESLNDERGQEGVRIDEECMTNRHGGGGGDEEDELTDIFSGLGKRMRSCERGQEGVQIGGGGGKEEEEEDGLAELISGLEKRMRSSESVEELMEVSSVLEKLREKVVKRVKYVQEDNFVDSLFSCDFWPPADENAVVKRVK